MLRKDRVSCCLLPGELSSAYQHQRPHAPDVLGPAIVQPSPPSAQPPPEPLLSLHRDRSPPSQSVGISHLISH